MTHTPVMCQEILSLLKNQEQGGKLCVLDATFGRGGHSKAILEAFPECAVIALDRDPEAVHWARSEMKKYGSRFTILQERFSQMDSLFPADSFSAVIMDLGVSSPQLDRPERGFSFMHDGPLDMRMNTEDPICAADIINQWREEDLRGLFFQYGQERWSRRIARAIVERRTKNPILTTGQLSDLIQHQRPGRGKIHPATRVFQALRIAVNKELDELTLVLPRAVQVLKPKGCLSVLSFHSLEDRILKLFFKESVCFEMHTKKPLRPSDEEIKRNPRSRSAGLRYGVLSTGVESEEG